MRKAPGNGRMVDFQQACGLRDRPRPRHRQEYPQIVPVHPDPDFMHELCAKFGIAFPD
jgi:hypothetical protein